MNDVFLKACRGEPTDYTPVWFMRQAGRYLPEYRKIREASDLLAICRNPELAAEVTLQPVRRLGVDAAILFADIMLVPIAMGVRLKIVEGVGPVIETPISKEAEILTLRQFNADEVDYVFHTIKILRKELQVPLIGFSGAPFTLASYLIEGKPSRDWVKTKSLMYQEPMLWHRLMDQLTDAAIAYLKAQIDAGVQAVQLFDSWVGSLSPADYRQYVLPYNRRIFAALAESQVPRILFGTNTGAMLADFASVDCEVVGVDWRISLSEARRILGSNRSLQGNLDPVVVLNDFTVVKGKVDEMLSSLGSRAGYISNLGHGVLPQTSPDSLKRLVDYVHSR